MNQDSEEEITKKQSKTEQKIVWMEEADISQSLYIGDEKPPGVSASWNIMLQKALHRPRVVSPHIGGWNPGFITAALSRHVQLKARPKLSCNRPQGCANIAS